MLSSFLKTSQLARSWSAGNTVEFPASYFHSYQILCLYDALLTTECFKGSYQSPEGHEIYTCTSNWPVQKLQERDGCTKWWVTFLLFTHGVWRLHYIWTFLDRHLMLTTSDAPATGTTISIFRTILTGCNWNTESSTKNFKIQSTRVSYSRPLLLDIKVVHNCKSYSDANCPNIPLPLSNTVRNTVVLFDW